LSLFFGGELQRPGRDDLVLLHHRAAHAVAALVALLEALEAAVTRGGIGVERKDGVARENEPSTQRAKRRADGCTVRRACAGRERLDLVAVVLQRRALATHAQHAFEVPLAALMPDGRLARHGRALPGGVAVLAFDEPASRPQEKGVLYPWTCTESAGACA